MFSRLHPAAGRVLFLLWCVGWLIVAYASLSPNVHPIASLGDKLTHLLGYTVMTAAAASFADPPERLDRLAVVALVLAMLFEAGQLFVPGRLFELADMAANTGGVVLGWTLGHRVTVARHMRPVGGRCLREDE